MCIHSYYLWATKGAAAAGRPKSLALRLPFALTCRSGSEKDKAHMTWLICESKNDTNELIYKTERDLDTENRCMVTKGKRQGRDQLGVWD